MLLWTGQVHRLLSDLERTMNDVKWGKNLFFSDIDPNVIFQSFFGGGGGQQFSYGGAGGGGGFPGGFSFQFG